MKTIKIYEAPMCCPTGVCGTEIDPDLINFTSMLSHLAIRGVTVERFNLGQSPMAFVENPTVKALLEEEGAGILPLVFLNGEIRFKGRYPTQDERSAFKQEALQ